MKCYGWELDLPACHLFLIDHLYWTLSGSAVGKDFFKLQALPGNKTYLIGNTSRTLKL